MRSITYRLSLILIFIIPWENIIEFGILGTLSKVVGLLLALLWLLTVLLQGRFRALRFFHGVVFLFALWNTASVFWSVDVGETIDSLQTALQLFGLVLILWDLYRTPAALQAALQAYVLGAYVSMFSIFANQRAGTTFLYQRYSATGFHVDDIGVILALGLPLAWYLTATTSHNRLMSALKIANYAYVPLALLGIALTGTRTALVAALPALIYGLASLARLKVGWRVMIFVVLVCSLAVVQSYVPAESFARLSTTGDSVQSADLNGRVDIWRNGVALFLERPLLGYGSGAFRAASTQGRVAHNTFLSVLVELGLVGLLLFLLIIGAVFYQAVRQPRWEARLWCTALLVWGLGASALTWEPRKQTWLFFALAIVAAGLAERQAAKQPPAEVLPAGFGVPSRRSTLT